MKCPDHTNSTSSRAILTAMSGIEEDAWEMGTPAYYRPLMKKPAAV
jgi:hypothetical protein